MNSGTPFRICATLWSGLRSLKLTLASLFLLAGSSIVGTILPQKLALSEYHQRLGTVAAHLIRILQLDNMYHSWWFIGLLGLFALNLVACSLQRLPGVWRQITCPLLTPRDGWLQNCSQYVSWQVSPASETLVQGMTDVLRRHFGPVRCTEEEGVVWLFAQRQSWARLGAYVTHLAILAILLGGLIGDRGGLRGYMTIPEGQTVDQFSLDGGQEVVPLEFSVRCDQFSVDYYAGSDSPREFRSVLTILDDGREVAGLAQVPVRVNHPLRYRGLTFYQSDYGVDAHLFHFVVTPREGEPFEIEVSTDRRVSLPDGTSLVVAGYISDFDGQGPAAGLQLLFPDGRSGRAMAFHNLELRDGSFDAPYRFRLLSMGQRWYTGLQVSRDPGLPVVWLGCLLLVVGTLVAFYCSHQRLWIQLRADIDGTRIIVAGQDYRHREYFAKRFANLCHDLRQVMPEDQP